MTNGNSERLGKASGLSRRLLALLVGLLATVALIASGTPSAAAQTRVGAQPQNLILAVGPHDTAAPDSVGVHALPQLRLVSATGVAAETATDVGASSAARGGVYTLRDEAGNVVRTGRTNDLAARETAHANAPVLGDFQFNAEYRTDVYAEQRGLEQVLYDRYPGAQAANGGFNKIRGISPTNPNLDFYMQSAWNFLGGG